jgi:hypothetical protein
MLNVRQEDERKKALRRRKEICLLSIPLKMTGDLIE